jgi:predicted GH43/DUF377 family glycosyl hydrolase
VTSKGVVTDTGIELRPDPSRVIGRFFVPGREDVGPGESRAVPVIQRVLQLDEQEVEQTLHDLDERFGHRHRDLHRTFSENAALVESRVAPGTVLSPARRLFLGATFTHEYAIEGAALCNPSAVLHPEQDASGDAAFVLSVRGIGEGHRSSIGFRTGSVTAGGAVSIDLPGRFPATAAALPGLHRREVFGAKLAELEGDSESAAYVLEPLPERFERAELDTRIRSLAADVATGRDTASTIANLRRLAESSYRVEFPPESDLSERVLWPHSAGERQGMEDARFVRFVDEDGGVIYYATYTAFDGANVSQQLLETSDFASFTSSPMAGPAAAGKGLALFPRKIRGQYVALSRSDRETNAVAFSKDLHCWKRSHVIQTPERPWEILQLGNCGSPIETPSGWLTLTHGVGPMRSYSVGAILLDLDDPQLVLASSEEPIISPGNDRRDGYVPNVVYSCGGFAHGDILVLPYGIGDQTIAVATCSINRLLGTMRPAR